MAETITTPKTMRTWRYSTVSGKLEDALVREDAAPAPDPSALTSDQLIVNVLTAALNPVDYKLPESGFLGSLMIKRPATPGMDYCGRVVAKHPSNSAVEIGQLVFGGQPGGGKWGTTGQLALTASSECAVVPEGVDVDHAAATGTAATTAYQSIVPHVKEGDKVFINGATGGVGTWAVQFAKLKGAHVVVSCSTGNIDLCKSLGADEVVNYTKGLMQGLGTFGQVFDAVIDNVDSPELFEKRADVLKHGGIFIQVGTHRVAVGHMTAILSRSFLPWGRRYASIMQKNKAEWFEEIGKWMAEGKVRAVIDEKFAWADVPKALAKVREGHAKGKVIIDLSK